MRAVLVDEYKPVEQTEISEIDVPVPGTGEVLVQVAAVGLGFVDGLKIQGKYQTKDPLPFTPCGEMSGVVTEVGNGVDAIAVGDRVSGWALRGGLAEYAVLREHDVRVIPDNVSFAAAAAYPTNYLTAIYALKARGEAKPGENLLVLGASGGTGVAAIQVGKLLGLRVLAGASTDEKRDYAIECGADDTVDTSVDDWRARLKEAGVEIDLIFDPVGGPLGAEAFRALGWKGRLLVIGFASGEIPVAKYNIALLKGASLVGVDTAQLKPREPELHRELQQQLVDWLAAGELEPAIGREFSLDDYKAAFAEMTERRARGKVIVRVADL